MTKYSEKIKKMTLIAIFTAIAYIFTVTLKINVQFLTFDFKDAVITLGAMVLGPISALIMTAITSFLEFVTVSGTGPWGLLMNFLSTAAFSITASFIYKRKRTLGGAVIALVSAILTMTAVMMVANIIITPIYTGAPRAVVIGMIPTLLLPFNLAKAVLNASVVMILYKPLVTALRYTKMVSGTKVNASKPKIWLAITVVSAVLIALSIVVFNLIK